MRKSYQLLGLFLTLFVSIPAQSQPRSSRPLSAAELARYQFCETDEDCVPSQNGCCDCANGGEDVAVNREQLSQFQRRFDCENVACTLRAATVPCGIGDAKCSSNRCRYEAPEPVRGRSR